MVCRFQINLFRFVRHRLRSGMALELLLFYVIALLIMQSHNVINRIGGVMVSVLASSEEDRGFEPRSGQTKDYKTGICSFSAKHAALRRKSKDWSARNQNNVFEWSDMSTRVLLFQ
jgi:hypothetical protein